MAPTYRIKNWNDVYENAASRKLKSLHWFASPNSFKGAGMQYIRKHDRKYELLCAWWLICRMGSRTPKRGLFVADSGRPLTSADFEEETFWPKELFDFALPEFCKIGWLEKVAD